MFEAKTRLRAPRAQRPGFQIAKERQVGRQGETRPRQACGDGPTITHKPSSHSYAQNDKGVKVLPAQSVMKTLRDVATADFGAAVHHHLQLLLQCLVHLGEGLEFASGLAQAVGHALRNGQQQLGPDTRLVLQ